MKSQAVFAFAVVLAFAVPASARIEAGTARVPKLDVEQSCRDARIYGMADPKQTYKNCMLDENEARRQLEKSWGKYKLSTKRQCQPQEPSPSYVELLTCIEMTEEILAPPSNIGGGGGGGGGGGMRSPGALGSPSPRPSLSPGPRAMPR